MADESHLDWRVLAVRRGLLAAALLLLSSCAAPNVRPTPSATPVLPAPAAAEARIWIEVAHDPRATTAYIEGSVTFVAWDAAPGQGTEVEHGDALPVAAGEHTLHSFVRPCSGNCGVLDGPADACQAPLAVAPGRDLTVTILLAPTDPCRISVREGLPATYVGAIEQSPFDGASLPYPSDGRCVLIDHYYVPVFPDGWSFVADDGVPSLRDADGRLIGTEGDLLWVNGRITNEQSPFGCDLGIRFDVAEVLDVDAFT